MGSSGYKRASNVDRINQNRLKQRPKQDNKGFIPKKTKRGGGKYGKV